MKCSSRWWNIGRYEKECAAFDAEHPLSREVWESLQRHQCEESFRLATWIVEPRDSMLLREPQSDPWEEFARRVMRRELERWYAANPVVVVGL